MANHEDHAGENVKGCQTNTKNAGSRMDRPRRHDATCHETRSSARESKVSDSVSTVGSLAQGHDPSLCSPASLADTCGVDVQDDLLKGEDNVSHRPCSIRANHIDENNDTESSCVLPAASEGGLVCVASSSATAFHKGAELGNNNSPHMSMSTDHITASSCVAYHTITGYIKVNRNSPTKKHQTICHAIGDEAKANIKSPANKEKTDFFSTTDDVNTNTSANSDAPTCRGTTCDINVKRNSTESDDKISHITSVSDVKITANSLAYTNKCDSHEIVDDRRVDGNVLSNDDKTTLKTIGDSIRASTSFSVKTDKTTSHTSRDDRDNTTSNSSTGGIGLYADSCANTSTREAWNSSLPAGPSYHARWTGQQLQSQGVSVIRRQIFSYLPALDLLHCCCVCRFWQLDADSELGRRPQMTWHTQYSADTSLEGRVRLWEDINTFLRELWLPASHVVLFMTKRAWKSNHAQSSTCNSIPSLTQKQHDGVVLQLSRNLPADCVISGGIARNGLTGTSSDLGETVTYEKWEMAVTLLILGRRSSLQLVPHDIFGRQPQLNPRQHSMQTLSCRSLQRSRSRSDAGVKDFTICLGATQSVAERYLKSNRGNPTFFLGSCLSFDSLDPIQRSAQMKQAKKPQCLLMEGRQVGQAVLSTLNVTTSRHMAELHANLKHFASTLHLHQRGLLALQHVTYSTACSERSKQRFHHLLRACNGVFRKVFPNMPLFAVLSECRGSESDLWHSLVDKAQDAACDSVQGGDTEGRESCHVTGEHSDDSSAEDPSLESAVSQDQSAIGGHDNQPPETEYVNEEMFCGPSVDVFTDSDGSMTRAKIRRRSSIDVSENHLSSGAGSSEGLAADCSYDERKVNTVRLDGRRVERPGMTCGVQRERSDLQNISHKFDLNEENDPIEFSPSSKSPWNAGVLFKKVSVSDASDANDDDDDFRDTSDDDWDDDDVMDIGYNDYDDCNFDLFTLFFYVT